MASDKRDAPWRQIWRLRDQLVGRLNNPFVTWLGSLDHEPTEITLLGGGSRLDWKTAEKVMQMMNGWFDLAPAAKGRAVGQRQVDGSVRVWPSRAAAAKALGLHRETIRIWLHKGKLFDASRSNMSRPANRPVGRIEAGGSLTIWPSSMAAARALGVRMRTIGVKLASGSLLSLG
jgi:hypothetical protein